MYGLVYDATIGGYLVEVFKLMGPGFVLYVDEKYAVRGATQERCLSYFRFEWLS